MIREVARPMLHAHTTRADAHGEQRLCCNVCGAPVSTAFVPVPTETPDRGLIVRGFIQCPECLAAAYRAGGAS